MQVGKERLWFRAAEDQSCHKVTIGLQATVMDAVIACINDAMTSAGVEANVVISWHGDTR